MSSAPLFSSFVSALDHGLGLAGFARDPIDSVHAEREGIGGARLRSYGWTRGADVVRCCHIASPRAEVFNALAYPADAARVPVFAAEYVTFGAKPVVAVVDLQAVDPVGPLRAEVERRLAPLAARFRARVTDGGELPEWARAHFTAGCIYARPSTAAEWPLHAEAFSAYLALWRDGFLASGAREDAARTGTAALAEYQAHHVRETPGRPFLTRVFGAEWTEDYLRQFMYPAARTLALEAVPA